MLTVHSLRASDSAKQQAWDHYVAHAPAATFFHLAGWQTVIETSYGHKTHFLYAERAGQIVGILPLAHVNSWLFGRSLASLPFAVYGGVVAEDEEAVQALEAEAEKLAQRLGVAHLEYRNISPRHSDWPTQDLYVTFRKEIAPDDEANLQAIPRKQRAMVRKGIKNGLVATVDPDIERFFTLFADNVHRHGTPAMPKRYFQCLKDVFGEQVEVMTITDADGQLLSSVLSFYFRDEVLPYYAGDALAARDLAANDFKYWALMQHAWRRGARIFDYGRSKQGTGSYSFKKNWGFEPTPLHYEYRLYQSDSIPQNNPSNAKYRYFIAAWRKLPRPVVNWLGPFIVRNLG